MAFARKLPSGTFQAVWVDVNGIRQRKVVPARSLTEARRLAEDLEHKAWRVRQGLDEAPPAPLTVRQAVAMYLAALPPDYSSRRDLATRLARVVEALGEMRVEAVQASHVLRMLAEVRARPRNQQKTPPKPLSPQTREHIRMAGQGLYTFLLKKAKALRGENPFAEAGRVRVPRREVRTFRPEHLGPLMGQLEPHHRAVSLFAVCTGCRKGEVLQLLKQDVNLAERYVLVRTSGHRDTTKGGRERRVPVPQVLVPVLERQLHTPGPYLFPRPDGKRWPHHWSLHTVIRRACERAGLPSDLRFKHLRSTWATLAYRHTGDIRLVQVVLGHQDAKTTERYALTLPEHVHEGAEAVAEVVAPVATTLPRHAQKPTEKHQRRTKPPESTEVKP